MSSLIRLFNRFAAAGVIGSASLAACAVPPVFTTDDGAIRGYDPVAYFSQSEPVKGKKDLSYRWNGSDWHFASQANLDAFQAAPEKYAPQYGGYCAYGVAQGFTPETDPAAFKVVDGMLYLNLSPQVARKWAQDIPGYVRDANQNWPRLKAGLPVVN